LYCIAIIAREYGHRKRRVQRSIHHITKIWQRQEQIEDLKNADFYFETAYEASKLIPRGQYSGSMCVANQMKAIHMLHTEIYKKKGIQHT